MRFKLDENLDVRLVALFQARGYDADTVRAEGLSGKSDEDIFEACLTEKRTLITLDLDFSNPFRFPPSETEGTIVLRPQAPSLEMNRRLCEAALEHMASEQQTGAIWIVEPGRVRIWRSRNQRNDE